VGRGAIVEVSRARADPRLVLAGGRPQNRDEGKQTTRLVEGADGKAETLTG